MSDLSQLTSIRDLPFPVAGAVTKFLRIPKERLVDRHSVLCDLFESLVKLLAVVALRESPPSTVKRIFPNGVDFLKHPSLGHWVQILRELCREAPDDQKSCTAKISAWYSEPKAPKEIREPYQDLPEISFRKGIAPVAGVIDSLVTYRNKVWKGHGAVILHEEDLDRRIAALESLLGFLVESASFLAEMHVFYARDVRKIDDSRYAAIGVSLRGLDLLAVEYQYSSFNPHEVYLARAPRGELDTKPVKLTPLVEWHVDDKGEGQFYFLNDVKRSKIEYLSHVDGSFHYHREVRQELSNLFSVAIQPASEIDDEKFYSKTEEERKAESQHFASKGHELASKGKWEGAIVAFEDALEWHRDPAILVAMCEAMLNQGDDPAYLLTILEGAFELDPDFEPAIRLHARLEDVRSQPERADHAGRQSDTSHRVGYLEAILPDRLRAYAGLLIVLFILVVEFALFAVGWLARVRGAQVPDDVLMSPILQFFQIAALAVALSIAKRRILDSYYLLQRQIANIREERFRELFDRSFRLMFGHLEVRSRTSDRGSGGNTSESSAADRPGWSFSVRPATKRERLFVVFIVVYSIALSAITLLTQDVKIGLPADVMALRFVTCMLYWPLAALVTRFVIGLTVFIGQFSEEELVPVISKRVGLSGFHALSKLFLSSLLLLNIFWIANVGMTAIFAKDPLYLDVLAIVFGYAIVLIWIIWVPMNIRRALQYSQSMAITDYNHHLRKAFASFVADPDEHTLERLDWLINHDTRVSRVSTRLLGWADWFKLALTHVLLAVVTGAFVAFRFGHLQIPFLIN